LNGLQMAGRESEPVDANGAARVAALLQRRMTGESVARIIGEREFYALAFGLNAATLEPRPDTELLVDLALKILHAGGRLLDLGTGTGCIPIAIMVNDLEATGLATDVSAEALEMAQRNATRHGVESRLDFAQGSWFEAVGAERFDLITSNPPYIRSDVVETLAPEVRDFDPRLALDGGPDGLAPYRILAEQSPRYLAAGGRVLVEIGLDQGEAVSALFREAGFGAVSVHTDLGGLDRVVSAHQI
jgi:release factor glutamine methyltransferase